MVEQTPQQGPSIDLSAWLSSKFERISFREEQLIYEEQYTIFLERAQTAQIPWFSAHLFANSCAAEYIRASREASKTPTQPEPRRYIEAFASQCLEQLNPRPSSPRPSWLRQAPLNIDPERMEQISRKKALERIKQGTDEYF
jgi:hypothetical protein